MYVALSVSSLRHTINTNSRSFSSTKRKIEIRKKTTRKNPSYFIKTKDSRIDRDRNKILGHVWKKKQTRRISSSRAETVILVARNGSEKRFPLGSAEGVQPSFCW